MKRSLMIAASLVVGFGLAQTTRADTVIGAFAGGVAETGWVNWAGGAQTPLSLLDGVYATTAYASDGDGGSATIEVPGNVQTLTYDAVAGGTVADFMANHKLVFDVAYAGIATDQQAGGFNEVWEVAFNSQNSGFSGFGGAVAGTFVGFAAGDQPLVEVLNIEIDYTSELTDWINAGNTPGGWLQIIFAVQDSNRPIKYIDNVRLTPEPASAALLGLGGLMVTARRRKA